MPNLYKTQEEVDEVMEAYRFFGNENIWGHDPKEVIPESAVKSIREAADACEDVLIFTYNMPFIRGTPDHTPRESREID
jgi:hypothetical protein